MPPEPSGFSGFYLARWGGLASAEIAIGLDETSDRYRAAARITTIGISRWLTHFKAEVAGDGTVTAAGDPLPDRYRARYDLRRNTDRTLAFRYEAVSGHRIAMRADGDTSTKPELDAPYRQDVVDPLAAMVALRQHLLATPPVPDSHFTVPVYDGSRRFDIEATVAGIDREAHQVRLALVLRPIAGFKGKTTDEPSPSEAPKPALAVFSDDARRIPLEYHVAIAWLGFVVRLDHLCPAIEQCGPG